MVSLGTITGASPLNADDTTYLTSNDQPANQTATNALNNMPSDFATMNSLSYSIIARLRDAPPSGPDTYTLEWAIVNASQTQVLAGASATYATRFQGPTTITTNSDQTIGSPTAFSYVDQTANKTAWDGALIEFRFNTSSQNMGPDANAIQVDYFQITGDYDAAAPSVTATPSGTGTPAFSRKLTAGRALSVSGTGTSSLTTLRAPRVWLNSTQTLSGATAMQVTAWSDTSITFTDPSGAPTGSLFLGVENMQDGGGEANTGWIAVTVNNANNRNLVANITTANATITSEADALLALQSAITTGDATVTSAATVDLTATSAITTGDATTTIDTDALLDITSAITTEDATLASSAGVPAVLYAAIITDGATVASTAEVDLALTSAITTADATVTSAGTVDLEATSAITTADATLASAAAVDLVITSAITTADATLVSTANSQAPPVELTAAITTADATLASAATVDLELTSAITTDDATLASVAEAALEVTSAITADDATLAANTAVDLELTSAITTAPATLVSTAEVTAAATNATVDITTADATLASDADALLELASAITADDVAISSVGTVDLDITLNITTAPAALASVAAVDLTASVGLTTDPATIVSEAVVVSGSIALTAAITTDDATLVATADDQEPAQPGGGGGFGWNRKDWQKAFEEWMNPKRRRGPRRRAKIRVRLDDAGMSGKFTRSHQAAKARATVRCQDAGMGATGTTDWSAIIALEDEEFDLWF